MLSLLIILIGFISQDLKAQAPAVLSAPLSPQIEWKDIFWPETNMAGNPMSQDDSSQDWFFDVIEYKKNGNVAGYVAVGFSHDQDFATFTLEGSGSTVLDCYTATAAADGCAFFLDIGEIFGHVRQVVVFYDLDGNVTDFYRYNLGEIWGVTQDENEDIYLFGFGGNARNLTEGIEVNANNETQLGTGPIYYNPTTASQPVFPLTCTSTEGFARKANIIKIGTNGDVIWNNYYGLPNTLAAAHPLQGHLHSGVFNGNNLLAGGFSAAGPVGKNKFLLSVNKTTGHVNWRNEFEPGSDGEIYEITKKNNQYLISGADLPSPHIPGGIYNQGFVSLVTDTLGNLTSLSFDSPDFYYTPDDIPLAINSNNEIDPDLNGRTTSAIFTDNYLYWFIVANNEFAISANGIAEGVVVQMELDGTFEAIENFGEIRAYDLWVSGIPTDDGGFALVTSRQSPAHYDTGTLPGMNTLMDLNNPSGQTIGDCLTPLFPNCAYITNPSDIFWKLMSTCSYVRKYDSNFNLQWDKIWDSSDNAPRECVPGNLKQQECVYRIIQSSTDGGLLICGNTSDNLDDSYLVKLASDCGLADFYGKPEDPSLIVDYVDGIVDIDVNTTWSTPKKVLGTVRVKPGITLTILNTTVEFATDNSISSRIDVEPNGFLLVDNSTLTSGGDCDNFWAGIHVWGDSDENQYYDYSAGQYYQGRLKVKNNSIIENSATAITNWNRNHWDERGGIVQVENSTFKNCSRAIEFYSYQNFSSSGGPFPIKMPDKSYVHNTDFNVDNDIFLDLTTYAPQAQITLYRTDRLRIEGCNFTNSSTVAFAEYRGKAINSSSANYIVKAHCNDNFPPVGGCQNERGNTFTGWHKAIEALGGSAKRAISVSSSDFYENMIGVEIAGAENSEIYDNNFYLGDHPYNYFDVTFVQTNLGVYFNQTLVFSLEDNDFEASPTAANDGYGVLVYNSEGAENAIYKNSFTNLKVAANGLQVNKNTSSEGGVAAGQAGLQFICNTNEDNEIDFEVSRFPTQNDDFSNAGIRQNQGSGNPARPAGNIFSDPTADPTVFTHFTVNSTDIYGYFYNTDPPLYAEMTPGRVSIQPQLTVSKNCPSNFTTGPIVVVGYPQLYEKINEFGGLHYTYSQIIDNGNTQGIITEIEQTWPQNAWELRDELIARSPYNSAEVLIIAALREIMPHAMLLEVLLSNPDALRSGEVILKLENDLVNPLPQYMIDLLWASRDQTTLRTSMESALSELHFEVSRIQKRIISQKAFADSTSSEPDSMIYYMSKVKTVEANYNRASALADRNQYSASINLLDSMLNFYKLDASRQNECVALKSFYSLLESANAANRTEANLSTAEIAMVKGIVENPDAGLAGFRAQNLLCFHYNICYDAIGSPKSIATPQKPKATYNELIAEVNTTSAYPNPASSYVTIQFNFLRAEEKSILLVYDNLGRQVLSRNIGKIYDGQELIDTRKLTDGLYLYQLLQNGKKVSHGK
ncbi:T9SS type A sorting domain-containing protein, partial [Cryomorpha ignava]